MGKTTRFHFSIPVRRVLGLLLACLLAVASAGGALAAGGSKNTVSRSIAIVFDNSGSMYMQGNKAWCRATYAIEVFASMMNDGDTLQVYPMYPVTSQGRDYSSLNPVSVSGGGDIGETTAVYNGTVDFGVTWFANLIAADAADMGLLEVAQVYQRSGLVLVYKYSD